MPNVLMPALFVGVVGCVQPAAEVWEPPEAPIAAESPLTMTLDPEQTLDEDLAARIKVIAEIVMQAGELVATTPVVGKALWVETEGGTVTARVFNHDGLTYPDILALDGQERTCTDFGLDGNVNDCKTHGEQDPELFTDPRWRNSFPSVAPSIGVPTDLTPHSEIYRAAHQAWFEANIAAFEDSM
jgi:hypothetical protein